MAGIKQKRTKQPASILPRYPIQDAQMRAFMLRAMFKASIPPALIYVYDRTELMVDEQGYRVMPPQNRRDYDQACRSWARLSRAQQEQVMEELRTWTQVTYGVGAIGPQQETH